ncbi:hypothetical protein ABBQ32_010603 [Trebouxia sp. C0010 RCD-2024]
MQICVKDYITWEVLGQVVVEEDNSVAFLKPRLWELQPDSFPRCRQFLYDGDLELEDEYALEDYEMPAEHTIFQVRFGLSRTVQDALTVKAIYVQRVVSIRSTAAFCGVSHGRTARSATTALIRQRNLQRPHLIQTLLKMQTWYQNCQKHQYLQASHPHGNQRTHQNQQPCYMTTSSC